MGRRLRMETSHEPESARRQRTSSFLLPESRRMTGLRDLVLLGMIGASVTGLAFHARWFESLRLWFQTGYRAAEIFTLAFVYALLAILYLLRRVQESNRALAGSLKALGVSERNFRNIVAHADSAILIVDRGNRIRYANPAAERLFETPASSLSGGLFAPPPGGPESVEIGIPGPGGANRIGEMRVTETEWHGERAKLVQIRDVTEIRRLQERMWLSQRLESLGTLAGGIAHDFNNLLMLIRGYSDLLLKRLPEGDPSREHIEEIRRAGERGEQLIRSLLAFGRRQVMKPRILVVNEIIRQMEKILRRVIGEDIEFETVLAPDLWKVRMDPAQLESALMNLALNARDAMPRGGKLMIETRNVRLDPAYVLRRPVVQEGNYVLIAVSDTGVGMPSEVRARIFEPFYTTKREGTGLGLASTYGIVKQSGGYIWPYSEPGHGTTFKIYLPKVEAEAEKDPPPSGPPGGKVKEKGNETVLLIEDEKPVRALVRKVLEQEGYTVLEAEDGNTALALSRSHVGPIQLVVTDIVMPGSSGPEVVEALLQDRPRMKVLFMSGYADTAVARHGKLRPGTPFLQKPITARTLALKVREVLDGGGERLTFLGPEAPSGSIRPIV